MAADEELVLSIDVEEVERANTAYQSLAGSMDNLDAAVRDADVEFDKMAMSALEAAQATGQLDTQADKLNVPKGTSAEMEKIAQSARDAAAKVGGLGDKTDRFGDKASSAFTRAARKARDFWRTLNPGVKAAALMTGLSFAINQVGAALGTIARVASAPARAFAEEEQAVLSLTVALGSLNQFNEDTVRSLQARAAALQETTRFSNTDIISLQAILTQLGGATEETLRRAEAAALDVSAALNKSLTDSMIGLAKAFKGNTDSVREWGLVLDSTVPKAEMLDHVLGLIESSFGGTAALQATSLVGQVEQLKNAWSDLLKVIGQGATVFVPAMNAIEGALETLNARFLTVGLGALSAREGIENATGSLAEFLELQERANRAAADTSGSEQGQLRATSDALRDLAKAREALLGDLGSLVLPVEFSISGGNEAEQQAVFDLLESLEAEAVATGERVLIDAVANLKALANEKLAFTITASADKAETVIKNLRSLLAGKQTIDIEFRSNLSDLDRLIQRVTGVPEKVTTEFSTEGTVPFVTSIDEMLAQVEQATSDPLTFNFDAWDGEGFLESVRQNRAEAAEILRFGEDLEARLPELSEEELSEISDALIKLFRTSIEEGFGQGIEASARTAERLVPVMRTLREGGQARTEVIVEQKGIDALELAMKRLREASKKGSISLVDPAEVKKAETLAEAFKNTRAEVAAMQAITDAPAQSRLLQGLLDSLDTLADDIPARRAEILAFKQELIDESGIELNVTINTEQAERDAEALGRILVAVLERQGAPAIDIIDAQMLARSGDNVDELRDRLDAVLASMTEIERAEIGEALFDKLTVEIDKAGESSTRLSTGVVSNMEDIRKAVAATLRAYRELAKVAEIRTKFGLAVATEDFAEAKRLLLDLDRIVQQFPDAVELRIEVGRLHKDLDDVAESSEDSASRVSETFEENLASISLQGLEDNTVAAFESVVFQADTFSDQMVSIIRAMVDQMIRELIRFAIARAALGIASGGFSEFVRATGTFTGIPGTGKPSFETEPTGKTASGRSDFRRSAVPVAAPASSSRSDRALARALDSLGTSVAATQRAAPTFLERIAPIEAVPRFADDNRVAASAGIESVVRNSIAVQAGSMTFNVNAYDARDIRRSLISRKPGSLGRELARATVGGWMG